MIKQVGYLYEVEAFFQESDTHIALMNDKKITVQRNLISGFKIEVED